MTTILEFLASALKWSLSRPRLALEGLLILALVGAGWAYNIKQDEFQRARDEHATLEIDLKEKITLRNNELEIVRRENGKVIIKRIFTPPEGSIVIKKKDHKDQLAKYKKALLLLDRAVRDHGAESLEASKLRGLLDKLLGDMNKPDEIIIKDKGFTFRPGFGLEVGRRGIKPKGDFKFLYYKRYSLMAGGSEYGLDVSASRHLDDILWGRPKNMELFCAYKFARFQKDDWAASAGIRVNLW